MSQSSEIFKQLSERESGVALQKYCTEILGRSEGLLFDYKEKADANTPRLDLGDKEKIAKAVSGFANAAGGILIWGIANNSLQLKEVDSPHDFKDSMLKFAATCTVPMVQNIDATVIPGSSGKGFVLLHVPQSFLCPHQVTCKSLPDINGRYYQRTGEGFHPMEHYHLADMFGKRQKPVLKLECRQIVNDSNPGGLFARFEIINSGRGGAKNTYLALRLKRPEVSARASSMDQERAERTGSARLLHTKSDLFERSGEIAHWQAESHQIIHPGMHYPIFGLSLWQGFTDWRGSTPPPLRVEYAIFCEDIPPFRSEVIIDPALRT